MEVIGGYRYYTRDEHIEWCRLNHIPPVEEKDEMFRNKRTLSGRPLLDDNYNANF